MHTNLLNNPAISRILQNETSEPASLYGIQKINCVAGEIICKEGEPGNGLYLLVNGSAIGTVNTGKHDVVVSNYGQGGFFGLASMAEGHRVHHLTIQCTSFSEIVFLPAQALYGLLRNEPMMWSTILASLSREIISIKNKMKVVYSDN